MQSCLFQNLLATIKEQRWRLLTALLMVLLSNSLLILNPLLFRQALIEMEAGSDSLFHWAAILMAVATLSAFFKYRMRYVFFTISREAEAVMRSRIFGRIQQQSAAFFDRHSTGELMSRLSRDVSDYQEVMGAGMMYPINFLTLVIPAFIALISISLPMAALASVPILILPLLLVLMRRYLYQLSRRVQESISSLSELVQEQFAGIRVVKSYAQEHPVYQRFQRFHRRYLELNRQLVCTEGAFYPFLALLGKWVTVFLVLLAAFLVLREQPLLTVADFVSFMWIQSYLFIPILMLGWVLPVYERGRAAYDRLKELYDEPVEVESLGTGTSLRDSSIELKGLSFRYPGSDRWALFDVDLQVKPGTFVGITGPVASGKSTLIRLLSRDYDVPKEMIFLGGKDIRDYSLKALQQSIAVVEQHPFLFSESLKANIRAGRSHATQDAILHAIHQAGLEATLDEFPDGLGTLLGERGAALSGGQRQRVATARAFLADAPILLLDDIFSAVDKLTETLIFEHLRRDFSDKTILLVTHRLSVLEKVDHIVYLSQAKVLEQGTHRALMEKQGHYAALCELRALSNGENGA